MWSKISLLTVAALMAMSGDARIIKSSDLASYTFEDHMKHFGVADSPSTRKAFVAELARVRLHNSNPKKTWTETMNRFSTMSSSEMKAFKGRAKTNAKTHQSLKGTRDMPSNFQLKAVSDLPQEVDWRTAGVVSAVKDQGFCGSCWAFSATATIESHVAIATGLLFNLSPEQVRFFAPFFPINISFQ